MIELEPGWIEEVVALDGLDLVVQRPEDPIAERWIDMEAWKRDEALPYWAELWPSGIALARALHGRAVGGMRVLELGCGLGLPSVVAALGGARVLATDWMPDALGAAQRTAALNGATVTTRRVDWADPDVFAGEHFDLVLAADVLYEERHLTELATLLSGLGATALIADPSRGIADRFDAGPGFSIVERRDPVFEQVRIRTLTPRR